MLQPRFLVVSAMILLPALLSLAPYVLQVLGMGAVHDPSLPWNVSPLGALCLFGGAYLTDRRWAYALPVLSLLLKSAGIALLMQDLTFGFHPLMPVVWGSFALMVWLGTWLRNRPTSALARIASIAGAALAGELLFFIVTNLANWIVPNDLYPHTWAGLVECYVAAIPYFRNSLASTALFSTVLFGGYALFQNRAPAAATSLAQVKP